MQNLAAANIDELLIRTRFNAQQVLEWIDQAILHSYLEETNIESFRRGGVRKVSDFIDLWQPFLLKTAGNGQGKHLQEPDQALTEARRTRALQLQSTPEYLDTLYVAVETGPNIAYIRNGWKNWNASIERRQAQARSDLRHEVQSVITQAQKQVFEQIGSHDFYDDARLSLKVVADRLAANQAGRVTRQGLRDRPPQALVGLGWWLWQNSEEGEQGMTAARRCYEAALSSLEKDPDFLCELSAFYTADERDDKAQEMGRRAITLLEAEGQVMRMLLTRLWLATEAIQARKLDRGLLWLEEADPLLAETQAGPERWNYRPEFEQAAKRFAELFAEEEMPETVGNIHRRLTALLAEGTEEEEPAGTSFPAHAGDQRIGPDAARQPAGG